MKIFVKKYIFIFSNYQRKSINVFQYLMLIFKIFIHGENNTLMIQNQDACLYFQDKLFFIRCTPKVSLVGVVLRTESLFSRTSAKKSTFRTQNGIDSTNYRYTANFDQSTDMIKKASMLKNRHYLRHPFSYTERNFRFH